MIQDKIKNSLIIKKKIIILKIVIALFITLLKKNQ